MKTDFLTVNDVARILNVGPQRVRQLEQAGELKAIRTVGGIRLFSRHEVERLIKRREGDKRETQRVR